jgi:hypothetical protein
MSGDARAVRSIRLFCIKSAVLSVASFTANRLGGRNEREQFGGEIDDLESGAARKP